MYKKHNYYGGGPVLGRNITIYKCFDNTPAPGQLSPQLQQQIINGANVDNTYTLAIPGNNITLFNFTLALKQLLNINPNLNVINATTIYANNPNGNSLMLNSISLPSDNIPQSNIFFVKVSLDETNHHLRLMSNPFSVDAPANALVARTRLITPAAMYWRHPLFSSRAKSLNHWLEEIMNNNYGELDIYRQGVDLTQPNVITLENFVRLFYSPLGTDYNGICPFEHVVTLWHESLINGIMDDADFLYLFANCDSLQNFRLFFTLLPVANRPRYEINGLFPHPIPPIPRRSCPIDFSLVPHVNLGNLDLRDDIEPITFDHFVAGQDYYRVQTNVNGILTTHYFNIASFENWITRSGNDNIGICRHPIYNVRVSQNDIVRFTYNPPAQGGAKPRKSRSYRKKNNKRSLRR
jgi:hypothetical protein